MAGKVFKSGQNGCHICVIKSNHNAGSLCSENTGHKKEPSRIGSFSG